MSGRGRAGAEATPAPVPVARIDFGPRGARVADGYVPDVGEGFDPARGYGWVLPGTAEPVDLQSKTRERAGPDDPRLRTLIHLQAGGDGRPGFDGSWEHALPAGTYAVTVAAGDADHFDSVHRLTVEGMVALAGFVPWAGEPFRVVTVTVAVADGRLTVDATGGLNTKLAYLDIARAADHGAMPAPTAAPLPAPPARPAPSPTPPPGSVLAAAPNPVVPGYRPV